MAELPGIADTLSAIGMGAQGLVVVPLTAAQIAAPTAVILANVNATYYLNTAPYTRYQSDGQQLNPIGVASTPVDLTASIQAQINSSLNAYNTTVQPKIDTSVGSATTTSLDGQTFTSVQALATYMRGLITGLTAVPSAPVPNVAPSVTFPGGTGDVGETATITAGTYSSGTVTGTSWNVIVNGTIALNTALPSFVIPASAGNGARSLQITELYSWSGGSGQTGKSSVVYTINAPVAIPVASTKPGPIVIANNIASAAHGLYSNTPTSYTQRWLDSLGAVLGTSLTLDVTTLGGRTITFEETAVNAAGSSLPNTSLPTTLAGGSVPTYVGGTEPGFVAASTYPVGTDLPIDFGTALNNPQGYDVQIYRNDVAAVNTGASATNVTSFSYKPINLDSGQIISATVVPRNAAGTGPSTTIPGVLISAAVAGGGGGTISFVAVSSLGSTNAGATVTPSLPSGAQQSDFVIASGEVNTPSLSFNTLAGWTANGGNSTIATPEGMSVNSFYKVLGASESAPTFTATGNEYKEMSLIAYRGATRVVATAVTTNNSSNASGFTVTWPSVTTDAANQVVVLVCDFDPANGSQPVLTLSNLPAGSATRLNVSPASGGNWGTQVILEVPIASAGATGTFTMTVTTDSTATGWIARTTAIGV